MVCISGNKLHCFIEDFHYLKVIVVSISVYVCGKRHLAASVAEAVGKHGPLYQL